MKKHLTEWLWAYLLGLGVLAQVVHLFAIEQYPAALTLIAVSVLLVLEAWSSREWRGIVGEFKTLVDDLLDTTKKFAAINNKQHTLLQRYKAKYGPLPPEQPIN